MKGFEFRNWRLARKLSGEDASLVFANSRGTICRWEGEWEYRDLPPWVHVVCEKYDAELKSRRERARSKGRSRKRSSAGCGKKPTLRKQRKTSLELVAKTTSRRISSAIKKARPKG